MELNSINQLRYFQAVAKTGNISHAAQELFITQSALSRVIARLEKELGILLFDRDKGKLVLNEKGKIFLSYVDRSLSELDNGINAIAPVQKQEFLVLFPCSLNLISSSLLSRTQVSFPDVLIRGQEYDQDNADYKELSKSAEVIFSFSSPSAQNAKKICEEKWCAMMSIRHPFANKKELALEELSTSPLIFRGGESERAFILDLFLQARIKNPMIIDNNISMKSNALDSGLGVALVPYFDFYSLFTSDPHCPLKAVPIKELGCVRPLYILINPLTCRSEIYKGIASKMESASRDRYNDINLFMEKYFRTPNSCII